MSQPSASLVDEIVAQVMHRLSRAAPLGIDKEAVGANSAEDSTTVMRLSETVLTADVLEQRLNGVKRVEFIPTAVLTPSARDYLRQRGVEWSRVATERAQGRLQRSWKALIGRSTPALESALRDGVGTGDSSWETMLTGSDDEAVETSASILSRGDGSGAAVFSAKPVAVSCAANRNERVRAAVAVSRSCVVAAREQIDVNLLCVDPRGKSMFELRNILREFSRT